MFQELCLRVIEKHALSHGTNKNITVAKTDNALNLCADYYPVFCSFQKTGEEACMTIINDNAYATAKPHIIALREDCGEIVVALQPIILQHIPVNLSGVTIIERNAVGSTKPHKAISVFQSTEHIIV